MKKISILIFTFIDIVAFAKKINVSIAVINNN